MVLIEYSNCGHDGKHPSSGLALGRRLTNSLTILEEPLRASLCTLESSLLEDFDFDLEVVLPADVDFDVDEAGLDDLVLLGSDIFGDVVALNGRRWGWRRIVYGEAVDRATSTATLVGVQKTRQPCRSTVPRRVSVGERHVRPMLVDGCGVVVCGEQRWSEQEAWAASWAAG